MLPTGPVLSPRDLPAFEAATPSPAVYDGDPRVPFLVLPVQIFGVLYQTDVVISTRHPRWDMHEYARIDTPEGHLWMAKDSDRAGVQTIIADLPDLDTVLAEVPVPRKRGAVVVQDDSEGEDIKLRLSYDNPDGEPVIAEYAGRMPAKPPRQRNGNTMGHSQHAVAVVLDISRMASFRHRAAISIGGQQHRIKRVAGLVPMHFLLRQAQGGLAVTSFRQEAADDAGALRLQRPAGAGERDPATGAPGWPTRRQENWTVESVGDSQHQCCRQKRPEPVRLPFCGGGTQPGNGPTGGGGPPGVHPVGRAGPARSAPPLCRHAGQPGAHGCGRGARPRPGPAGGALDRCRYGPGGLFRREAPLVGDPPAAPHPVLSARRQRGGAGHPTLTAHRGSPSPAGIQRETARTPKDAGGPLEPKLSG